MGVSVGNVIPRSEFKETYYKESGASVEDIMQAIILWDNVAFEDTEEYSKKFDFSKLEDFKRLWHTVRFKIKYRLDKPGEEVIKSPSATWWSKFADCKSKSLFTGSVLRNSDINVSSEISSSFLTRNIKRKQTSF